MAKGRLPPQLFHPGGVLRIPPSRQLHFNVSLTNSTDPGRVSAALHKSIQEELAALKRLRFGD